jgi:DNA-binding MarR family transcriptional regulator
VERSECHDDGRGAWVILTKQGRSAIERAAPGHAATVRRLVFDDLSPQELRVMTRVIDKVLNRLIHHEQAGPTSTESAAE